MGLVLKLPFVAACLLLIRAQDNMCTRERLQDFSLTGSLLEDSLLADGQGNDRPMVTITRINEVCLATAPVIGLYRSASVVIEYTCTGVNCPSGEASNTLFL